MSATVYFDNLQSGEVAQLLNSMGHHTVGLRLQRKGDRSPVPGQSWGHEAFGAGGTEVVLVSAVARAGGGTRLGGHGGADERLSVGRAGTTRSTGGFTRRRSSRG